MFDGLQSDQTDKYVNYNGPLKIDNYFIILMEYKNHSSNLTIIHAACLTSRKILTRIINTIWLQSVSYHLLLLVADRTYTLCY